MNEKELINKLVVFDISQNLHHGLELIQTYEISEEEIELLCKVASIKSLSDDSEEQSLAYEIITKLFKNFSEKYPSLYSITYSILSRLVISQIENYLKILGLMKANYIKHQF